MSKFNFSVILYDSWEDNANRHHVVVEADDWQAASRRAEEVCPGFKIRSVSTLGYGTFLVTEAYHKWLERGDTDYLILS